MYWLNRTAQVLTVWSARWVPGAFTIACLLTMVSYLAGIFVAGKGPLQCLQYWADGFWTLLVFAMQMCLIVITGYIVAVSPSVDRFLNLLADMPKTPRAAVITMALVSMLLGWIHWGLGLVTSAVFVRFLLKRHPGVDFRLLVAAAYLGMGCTWHAGLSGSAPLLVATQGHFLEAEMGVVPMSETIFTVFNLSLVLITLVVLAVLVGMLYPRGGDSDTRLSSESVQRVLQLQEGEPQTDLPAFTERSLASFLESTYWVNLIIGGAGVLWIVVSLWDETLTLSIDKLNFIFLFAGLLLHRNPHSFVQAGQQGVRFVHGIILQFPLYAGIFGIISASGLSEIIGNWFVSLATTGTFPLLVYWYSGILNYFVPSGGSKWAVEAPYLLFAARQLDVPIPNLVLAYAWGDMTSNLLQPFWCIPLLSAARLEFREIIGYEIVLFVFHSLLVSLAIFLFL